MSECSILTRVESTGLGRREFLRAGLRNAAAVAIVAATAFAVQRRAGAACRRPNLCGECPVFSGCDLSKATEYRSRLEANQESTNPGGDPP